MLMRTLSQRNKNRRQRRLVESIVMDIGNDADNLARRFLEILAQPASDDQPIA